MLLAATLILVFTIGVAAAYARTSTSKGTIDLSTTPLGKVLVSANGHTLYLFRADKGPKSVCYGTCAKDWPPLLTAAKPRAGAGLNVAMIGTSRRRDGKLQVTYHGHPLYWFFLDKKAGQTKGQALDFFGGKWYVVNARGVAIVKSSSPTAGSGSGSGYGSTTTSTGGYGGGYGGG